MTMEEPTLVHMNGIVDQSTGETAPQLEGEQLRQALLKQLEYYFSRENLEKDDFLKSQMNAEFFVPIHVISAFKMVRNLTTDHDLIVEVLRSSKEVVVSEAGDMVRPQIKTQRSTLILRDISSETPQDEIQQIFKNEGCAPVKHIRADIGNTWFVTFETEQDALKTLMVLRTLTFKDQPIQARVKSENPLKNLLAPVDSFVPNAPYFTPQWNGYFDYHLDPSYQGAGNGKHPRSPSQNGRGPRAPRTPRPDQLNQAQSPGQNQPQLLLHREPGNRGNRENRDSRQENRPEGKSDPRSEHKASEGRMEVRNSRNQENRGGASGESSREAGSARKGNERSSLPSPLKEGQEGYKPKTGNQGGKRGTNGQSSGNKNAPQKAENQPRGKPKNVPLGPESFPPLPGAPAAKTQEINLTTLNYSAVAHAGADKPVHERPSNRRNRSHENSEKKPSPAGKVEASSSEEIEAPPTSEPREKEVESPEAKEETEGGKGQPSNRSYAEILRAKAALKEQSASPPAAAAEEAAADAVAPAPASASTSSPSQRNHESSKKGGESSGRGNRSQNRRNPSTSNHKENGKIEVDSEGFQKPSKTSRSRQQQDRSERYKERQPRSRVADDSTPNAHASPVASAEVTAPAQSE